MTRDTWLHLTDCGLLSMDHHVNSLAVGSQLLSPGTTNLIAMTKRRVDR